MWPWNVVWLVSMNWEFHVLMSGRIIPTIGKLPWSFDSALEFPLCHLACRLRTKVYLKLTCLSSWIYLILFGLCYDLGLSHSFKSCTLPPSLVSCSFPEPCPGPQCCLYNLLEGQPENSWPLGGKYCIISKPTRYSGLHLPCFLQHVQQ